jgi:mitochondrial fission protein ELM1
MQDFREIHTPACHPVQALAISGGLCQHPCPVTRPLILWLLGDGKAGHENQSLGLAEAMARRTPCSIYRIPLAGSRGLLGRVRAALAASAPLPKPDLILAAGHATHFPLLWLALKHRTQSLVLMRPSLPLAWFDLCIAPAHDFPVGPQGSNIILTRGALNRVVPPARGARTGHMLLIGGPSATHGWNAEQLLDDLAQITDQGAWQLTDSRRTPAGFTDEIRRRLPAIEVFSYQETPPDWLPEKLAAARDVWVTEDSVSMIYEALSSGASVGLLPVPRLKPSSRVLLGLEELVTDGFLTPMAEWQQTRQLKTPPETLREADRCVEEVTRKMDSSHFA